MSLCKKRPQHGAALLMVLIVLGLFGAFFAMRTLSGTVQQIAQEKSSLAVMVQAQDVLLGFAAVNGRLPCPATAASNGIESYVGAVGASACTLPYTGFLPAVTLGLPGVDATGYLLDGWGGRVRYAVTTANANAATSTNGIQLAPLASFAPNVNVCASATGITATTCGTAPVLTSTAVAVIFSLGANASGGGVGGIDEAANQNNDPVFVSHAKLDSSAVNGEFDDLLAWLPLNTLTARMIQAGRLP